MMVHSITANARSFDLLSMYVRFVLGLPILMLLFLACSIVNQAEPVVAPTSISEAQPVKTEYTRWEDFVDYYKLAYHLGLKKWPALKWAFAAAYLGKAIGAELSDFRDSKDKWPVHQR